MTVEAAGFIDDIDPTQPPGTDNFSEGDNHLRNFKKSVQDSFPNVSGEMSATHTELNNLDGYTGNTADFNILSGANAAGLTAAELLYVKGVTSDIQTQIDAKLASSAVSAYGLTLIDDANASAARSTLGLGSLATASSVVASNFDTDNVFSDSSAVNNAATAAPGILSIPAGIYWVMRGSTGGSEQAEIQAKIEGTWRTVQVLSATIPALHYQDSGTLTRIYNPSGGAVDYISYVKLN